MPPWCGGVSASSQADAGGRAADTPGITPSARPLKMSPQHCLSEPAGGRAGLRPPERGRICHPMVLQGCPSKATTTGLQVPVHPFS